MKAKSTVASHDGPGRMVIISILLLFLFAVGAFVLVGIGKFQNFVTFSSEEVRGFVFENADAEHLWYVHPDTRERFFINSPAELEQVIRQNLLGISEQNAERLSWDEALGDRLRGILLLRVEHFGEVWYVEPENGRLIQLQSLGNLASISLLTKLVPSEVLREIPVSAASASWVIPPEGYISKIAAAGFVKPRVLAADEAGHLFVSDSGEEGRVIALQDHDDDGLFEFAEIFIQNLFNPHGIAFAEKQIFVAAEHALYGWHYDAEKASIISPPKKYLVLPPGGGVFAGQGHRTRTVLSGNDGFLYISVGSNCDHCFGADQEHALIYRLNLQTGISDIFARGLRNTVFFTRDEQTGIWWGNDMGQDNLGADLPPDELNQLEFGAHYGWPYCYGQQESVPENNNPGRCRETRPNTYSYPAHVAPLGLRFIPSAFSESHQRDLLVAFHGASVIEERRGYEVVRVEMEEGEPQTHFSYLTGFLRGKVVLGRPVDLLFDKQGRLYVTDDYANVIHVIEKAHSTP